MKKALMIIIALTLLAAAGLLLKKRKDAIAQTPLPSPIAYSVNTVMPRHAALSQTHPFLAKLESAHSVQIASKLSGRIESMRLHEGMEVKKGALLLSIDSRELESTIASAKTSLEALKSDAEYTQSRHARNAALYKAGGLAKEQFDASEVAYLSKRAAAESAQQKIEALEAQRDYLQIRAPFEGSVGTLMMHAGDLATAGRSIMTLNAAQQKLTFAYVPTALTPKKGQSILMENKKIGTLSHLYSDAQNGLAVAEAQLFTPIALPNGTSLSVELVTAERTGCSVPLNALLHTQNGTSVMRYAEERFTPMEVSVTLQNAQRALIEPCPAGPVAVASEAKLSLLGSYTKVRALTESGDE